MAGRVKYSFYIDDEQARALKAIKARDGVLESEQIRRALDDWIFKKDVYDIVPNATRKRYDLVNHEERPARPPRKRARAKP